MITMVFVFSVGLEILASRKIVVSFIAVFDRRFFYLIFMDTYAN